MDAQTNARYGLNRDRRVVAKVVSDPCGDGSYPSRPLGYYPQYFLVLLIIVVLALFTSSRNTIWHSDAALWQDVVGLSALKGRPRNDLAMAEFRAGRTELAISGFKKALTLGEGLPMIYSNLGAAYAAMGRFEAAEAEQRRAIALMPAYAPAHGNLGIALYALGRIDSSLQAFRQAASLTELPRERHNLANALTGSGRLKEAIEGFRTLLRAYDSPAVRNDLGLALTANGEEAAAMVEYKKALALDGKYVNSIVNIAALYMRGGDSTAALENYNAALLLAPDNATLHYHLGLYYETADNTNKARSHYERFLALASVKDRALVGRLKQRFSTKQ